MNFNLLALADAVKQTESGGDYNRVGKSGERGAYQFMPDTWKSWAKEHLGNPNAPMTRQNQDRVALKQIEKWAGQGFGLHQIASLWNAGNPNAYLGNRGVNKYGVQYNTTNYVNEVISKYSSHPLVKGSTEYHSLMEKETMTNQKPNILGDRPTPLNPHFLRKEDVIKILQNRPQGMNPARIIEALVQKGYTLEGYGKDVQSQTIAPQKQPKQGFLQKAGGMITGIGKFLTQSEQNFGKDIAQAHYVNAPSFFGGGSDVIGKVTKQYMDNGNTLIDLMKKTTDPQRKQQLAKMAIDDFQQAGKTGQDIIGEVRSKEQILGDAAGVLVDVLASGTYGKATEGMKSFQLGKEAPTLLQGALKGVGFKRGAIEGAKAGAKFGAVFGGAQGVARGLQENKGAGGVAISGLVGAGEGAIGGAVIGGATGGVSGAIKARQLGSSQQERALNAIIPMPKELTSTEYEEYLSSGRVSPKTAKGTAQIIPTNEEIELANQWSELLQSKDPVRNGAGVLKEIASIDSEVGDYLKTKNLAYSKVKLKDALLEKVNPITDVMVPNEERLTKLKEDLVQGFIDRTSDDTTLYDLWQSRKSYDSFINSRLNAFGGSPTLKKELATNIRNGVQEFITQYLEESKYQESMKNMTNLYHLLDAVNNKATRERGVSIFGAMAKKYPNLWKRAIEVVGIGTAIEGGKKLITGKW